jgi:hypothetical protein
MSSWHTKPIQKSILSTVKKILDSQSHPGFYVNRLRESLEDIHIPANRYANRVIRLILTNFAALRPCKCGAWFRGGAEIMCKRCSNALNATRTNSTTYRARRAAKEAHRRRLKAKGESLKRRCCVKFCTRRGFIRKTKFGPPEQIIYCCDRCWPGVNRVRGASDYFKSWANKKQRWLDAHPEARKKLQDPFKPVVPALV